MISLLIAFFALAIIISFLCSMWEAVLLSITPSYAQLKLREGTRVGRRIESFKQNIDRPLAAILTLNTIAHTVGAIGVGDQAARIWSEANPMITGLVVPVVMTIAILVLSELIPKTLGANFWQELAPFTVNSLHVIITVLAPLVLMSQLITRSLKKDKSRSVFSRMDFLAMAEVGEREGVFDARESGIIANLLRFNTVTARDVMTPRTVVEMVAEEETIAAFAADHGEKRFSRIPLYHDHSRDHVSGYVRKDDILAAAVEGRGEEPVSTLRRDLVAVAEDYPIPELFNRFLDRREHIALVVDEFGGMAGIVTMEDVIETLIGMEIVDELDHAEDMQVLARRSWERRARRRGLLTEPTPDREAGEARSAPDRPADPGVKPADDPAGRD